MTDRPTIPPRGAPARLGALSAADGRLATPARRRRAVREFEGRENDWRDAITALAGGLGYLVYFTMRSTRSPAGFPDLVIVTPPNWPGTPTLIVAELKRPGNRPTLAQRAWLDALAAISRIANAAVGRDLMLVCLWIVPDEIEAITALLRQRAQRRAPRTMED